MIIFLGLDNAGKTSIKVYLETLDIEKAKNTKMSNQVEVYQRGKMRIEIFPGQKLLRMKERLYEVFFPYAKRIAFIVDSADKDRIPEVREYWGFVKSMITKYCEKTPEIILVAHKQDLQGALSAKELMNLILDKEDQRKYSIIPVETTIYDPISMSLLLRALHGGHKLGIDQVVDSLRERTDAELAFIYDNHLLPIATSVKSKDETMMRRLNDIVIALEKVGELRIMAGYFADGKNIIIVSDRVSDERILVGIYNFSTQLREAIIQCKNVSKYYLKEMRERMWESL